MSAGARQALEGRWRVAGGRGEAVVQAAVDVSVVKEHGGVRSERAALVGKRRRRGGEDR